MIRAVKELLGIWREDGERRVAGESEEGGRIRHLGIIKGEVGKKCERRGALMGSFQIKKVSVLLYVWVKEAFF